MKTCSQCPAELGPQNRSGRCRSCSLERMRTDPAICEKRRQTLKTLCADPVFAERRREAVKRGVRALGPAHIEKLRANGRIVGKANLTSPEVQARSHSPECRERRRLARQETMLGWCPPERRDDYRFLLRKKVGAAEARRIIEAEIAGTAEHARRLVANNNDAARIREERRKAQAY
jgi:hypothetical protein